MIGGDSVFSTEKKFLYHAPCPKCGSQDNVAVWQLPDGSLYGRCFTPGCDYKFHTRDETKIKNSATTRAVSLGDLIDFEYRELPARGVSKEVAAAYLYGVGRHKGELVHVANYVGIDGAIVAQKIRTQDKKFYWLGNPKEGLLLFGQHLWNNGNGKTLVITEGEIDALSIAQATSMSMAVVSIPNGAGGAARSIKDHLDWIESFSKIVLAFDNDSAGKHAMAEVVKILTPGKVYTVSFGKYKDANEVLLTEGPVALKNMVRQATPYTPEGVVLGTEIHYDFLVQEPDVKPYDIPFPILNAMMRGLHKRELTLLTAGTGVGKSTMARELAYHLAKTYPDIRVGFVALEESVRKSALGVIALHNNIPLGELYMNPDKLSPEQYESTKPILEKFVFYDHFGSLQSDKLFNTLRYMALGLGVDFIFLDHISIVVSGLETHDERKLLDIIMTRLRQLVEQTGVGMVVISHLRKFQSSTTAEEGRRIVLDDLRGSGALKQLADNVIALETEEKNLKKIRVLKNRLFGDIGEADLLIYDETTGRLTAAGADFGF